MTGFKDNYIISGDCIILLCYEYLKRYLNPELNIKIERPIQKVYKEIIGNALFFYVKYKILLFILIIIK